MWATHRSADEENAQQGIRHRKENKRHPFLSIGHEMWQDWLCIVETCKPLIRLIFIKATWVRGETRSAGRVITGDKRNLVAQLRGRRGGLHTDIIYWVPAAKLGCTLSWWGSILSLAISDNYHSCWYEGQTIRWNYLQSWRALFSSALATEHVWSRQGKHRASRTEESGRPVGG